MRRSYDPRDFPASRVAAAKRGRRVSVCLPARNEESTIADTVLTIRKSLMEDTAVVDELLVLDDGSTDATAAEAAGAGAAVVRVGDILSDYDELAPGPGKGQAMWKAVHACSGDVIAYCDADISDFDPAFVLGLVGPLLTRDDVNFVKGFYERPLDGRPGEGGRVTELMARPAISVFFPHLADIAQPLSGECAARREVLEGVPFVGGYGVDLGLLIDVTARFGNAGLVQCDLGRRVHRNRPLVDLSPQALAVLQVVLHRADPDRIGAVNVLLHPERDPVEVTFAELPPLAEVPAHRMTA